MIQQSNQKPKIRTYTNDGILESLRDLTSGIGKSVSHDVVGKIASDALTSLTGGFPQSGELTVNQVVDLSRERKTVPSVRLREFVRPPIIRTEDINLKQQIEAVRMELKALSTSMKTFQQEVQKAVDQVPPQPGVYHLNFFERLRIVLQLLREQIDDSRTWLACTLNRKQKTGYWRLYKKHGTQFGLSSERTIATQAG